MNKIIFLLWLLSGKVCPQYDVFGYRDYGEGRPLYHVGKDSFLYKGEVLNYIRTGKLTYNELLSDKTGREEPEIVAFDTIAYGINKSDTIGVDYPLYKKGKRIYCIDPYTKQKIYLEAKK
jgi:hypothetical protein